MKNRTTDLKIPLRCSTTEPQRLSGGQIHYGNRDFDFKVLIFSLSHARGKIKNIFLHLFNELKIYHISYSIHKKKSESNYYLQCKRRALVPGFGGGVGLSDVTLHPSIEALVSVDPLAV